MPKLGQKVQLSAAKKGVPPVVFAVQPTAFFAIKTSEDLKQWEQDLRSSLGVNIKDSGLVGTASESCSGGCSDDCDMI